MSEELSPLQATLQAIIEKQFPMASSDGVNRYRIQPVNHPDGKVSVLFDTIVPGRASVCTNISPDDAKILAMALSEAATEAERFLTDGLPDTTG